MATYATIVSWRFELAMLYDRAVAASNRVMATWDGQLTAWQLRRGSVELVHGAGRLRGGPGDWLLIPPGVARRHRFSDDAAIRSIRCLVVDPAGRMPGLGRAPLLLREPQVSLNAAADRLAAVAGTSRTADLPPAAWSALHGSVIAWCASCHELLGIDGPGEQPDARVAAAQRLLLATRSPAALPWPDLRTTTGLSRPQLDRLFHRHCGGSVRAWNESRLLADACTALGDRSEPVKAVSANLGFGDASHFCRWFRQRTGASPADWRRRGGT